MKDSIHPSIFSSIYPEEGRRAGVRGNIARPATIHTHIRAVTERVCDPTLHALELGQWTTTPSVTRMTQSDSENKTSAPYKNKESISEKIDQFFPPQKTKFWILEVQTQISKIR